VEQRIVAAEREIDDIRRRQFLCADPHAIESVDDKRHPGFKHIPSLEKLSVSRNDFFHAIFGVEHVKQFSPSWSLYLSFILFVLIIRNDDIKFFVEYQSLLHIDILEERIIRLTLRFEDRILYRIHVASDVGEIIGKIQEGIANKNLNWIFQSVQEFLILFKDDLLFVTVFEIKVYSVDSEDGSESAVFHDNRVIPDFRYRQHGLRIEEIFMFRFLDFVFFSHIQEHPLSQRDKNYVVTTVYILKKKLAMNHDNHMIASAIPTPIRIFFAFAAPSSPLEKKMR